MASPTLISKSSGRSRYRVEDGQPCIDVKIDTFAQLFDHHDPAPFRERDLDPAFAEYLRDAGEDLVGQAPFRVVFWLDNPGEPGEVRQAFRAHFEDLLERSRRTRRRHRRTGFVALLFAVLLIVTLLSLSQFIATIVPGLLGTGLKESLVISSWVVMWRPIDILVYEWIPVRYERKVVSALLEASIEVRSGTGG
jgi:hypothetical protein